MLHIVKNIYYYEKKSMLQNFKIQLTSNKTYKNKRLHLFKKYVS